MQFKDDCKCIICEFNDGTGTCLVNPYHDECGICMTRKLKSSYTDNVSILIGKYNIEGKLIKDFTEDHTAPEYLEDGVDYVKMYEEKIKEKREKAAKSFPPGILGRPD